MFVVLLVLLAVVGAFGFVVFGTIVHDYFKQDARNDLPLNIDSPQR